MDLNNFGTKLAPDQGDASANREAVCAITPITTPCVGMDMSKRAMNKDSPESCRGLLT